MDAMTTSLRPAPALSVGAGMLAIWHDVASGQLAEVRDWYAREHHFERLAIPGFLEARRYERVSGAGADVFGCYRVESPQVLRSSPYLARVDAPTPWTREMMRHFRNMCRTVCAVDAQMGRAQGGYLATLASAGDETDRLGELCAQLQARPGVLRVTALTSVAEPPQPITAEQALRGRPDAQVRWALLLDADNLSVAQDVLEAASAASGCREPVQSAVYRLCFSARSPH